MKAAKAAHGPQRHAAILASLPLLRKPTCLLHARRTLYSKRLLYKVGLERFLARSHARPTQPRCNWVAGFYHCLSKRRRQRHVREYEQRPSPEA
jgi:hypothetical protein